MEQNQDSENGQRQAEGLEEREQAGATLVNHNWQSEAASRAGRSIRVRKLHGNVSFK